MANQWNDLKIDLAIRKYGKHYKWNPRYWRFQFLVKYKKWKYQREMDLANAVLIDPEATKMMGEQVHVTDLTIPDTDDY